MSGRVDYHSRPITPHAANPSNASMLRNPENGDSIEADHIVGFMLDKARALGVWRTEVAPLAKLDTAAKKLTDRIVGVPKNQLMMHKLMINQAVDKLGLEQTQMFATLFNGITRHSPEGQWFKRYAETYGYQAAVEWRDSGRAIPEPRPGSLGNEFMSPPPAGARSLWSSDVMGKRKKTRKN